MDFATHEGSARISQGELARLRKLSFFNTYFLANIFTIFRK